MNISSNIKTIADELEISFNDVLRLFEEAAKIDDYNSKDEQPASFW